MTNFQRLTIALLVIILMFTIVAAAPKIENIKATMNHAIKITLDGQAFNPKDANGKVLKPIVYNGSVYLPVRAVADAAGLKVNYNTTTSTVELTTGKLVQNNSAESTPGRFPTGDWLPNKALKRLADMTFVNTGTTGDAAQDKSIIECFVKDMEAIGTGSVYAGSEGESMFILDSPTISNTYELSSLCSVGKAIGLDVAIVTKDLEIVSLGFNPSNYELLKKNPESKSNTWQAVVVKGTININVSGSLQSMSGYHVLVKDAKTDNALKYYTQVNF